MTEIRTDLAILDPTVPIYPGTAYEQSTGKASNLDCGYCRKVR